MFPFIFWLGADATGDAGPHDGGVDFLRRRVIMATLAEAWSPLDLSPLGDYLAQPSDISVSGTNISQWIDRSVARSHLVQSNVPDQPDYDPAGWASSPSVYFNGGPFLVGNSGTSINTALSGTHTPFSGFAFLKFDNAAQDETIFAWDNTTPGNAQSILRIDNTGGGTLRYTRQDDASSNLSFAGAVALGNNKITVGVTLSSSGLAILYYQGTEYARLDMGALGACTFNRFRVGTGPLAIDALAGNTKHVHVGRRAYTATEMLRLHRWATENFP